MLILVFAFLSACAFSLPYELLDTAEIGALMPYGSFSEKMTAFLPVLGKRMYPQGILLYLLFFLTFYVLSQKIKHERFSAAAFLISCLFSLYLLCGECAILYKELAVMFRTFPQCLITVVKFSGYLPLFYMVVRAGYSCLDERKEKPVSGKISLLLFEKHSFLAPFVMILVCWLPYLIAFYPGFVPSDGLKQLNNFFGSGNFTDNHPAFSSMMMGWTMRIGRFFGSDNLGVFLFTGPQAAVNAAAMAYCFPLFKKLKSPLWLRKLALFSFSLIPIWPNYAYSLLKDSYYMAMILLFVILMIRILVDAEAFCSCLWKPVLTILTLTLMMLVRHEGQYVGGLIFLLLFTVPGPRRQWKKLLPLVLIPLCIVNIFNRVIRPALNIPDAPAREALTMPIRQTAAVVMEMEDRLTEDESAVLHELFVYENIPEMFATATENGDNLKGQFDPWASRDAIFRYMKVWAELGLKHPLVYLNMYLCANSRYYDPFLEPYRNIYGWFGIEQADYVNKGLFDIFYRPGTAALRSALINLSNGLPKLPFFSLFYSLGLNAWLMLFLLSYLLRKKIRGVIIPLLPGVITFILIQNSAINGFFRYMLPLLITLPVSAAWAMSQNPGGDRSSE